MYNVFEEEKSRKKMIVSDNPIIVDNVWDSDSGAEAEQYMKHFFVDNFINEISMLEKKQFIRTLFSSISVLLGISLVQQVLYSLTSH